MTAELPHTDNVQPSLDASPLPAKKSKRKKRIAIGVTAGVVALALAGVGTAYGVNAANVRAYDAAATQHAELLDDAALAESQLPLAQHGYVAAWQLATGDKNSASSQVALVAAADDKLVGKDAKAGLAPLAEALKALAADKTAAPAEDDLAASEAVQQLMDDEKTDATAFAPAEPTGQFALSDEGADTSSAARDKVNAAVDAAQEQLDELNAQLAAIEERHDALDAALIAAAPELLAAAESAVELAPAWKETNSKADAAAFDAALKRLQASIKGSAEAEAPSDALFEAPHTVEPDEQSLLDAQEQLAALADYVAKANALKKSHADAVAAEEAAAAEAAAAVAAAAQQPAYDSGWDNGGGWGGNDSGWNGGGGGGNSGGGGGGNSGGGGGGGFTDYGTGGGGGGGNTPPPGTCYRADSHGPEICY